MAIDDILTKAVEEIFRQSKQVNQNFSADWNEGFNDGMFHTLTIIRGIIKESEGKDGNDRHIPL